MMTILKQQHLILADNKILDKESSYWLSNAYSQHVIVVLTGTTSIDSCSLQSLIKAHIQLSSNHKKLLLINPSAPIRTLLYLTKIADIIPYFVNIQDAIKHLQE